METAEGAEDAKRGRWIVLFDAMRRRKYQ